jgi:hypothetical protein
MALPRRASAASPLGSGIPGSVRYASRWPGDRASISSEVRPDQSPTSRSRRPGSTKTPTPATRAMISAVARARTRSEDTTTRMPRPCMDAAAASAWATPSGDRGGSATPATAARRSTSASVADQQYAHQRAGSLSLMRRHHRPVGHRGRVAPSAGPLWRSSAGASRCRRDHPPSPGSHRLDGRVPVLAATRVGPRRRRRRSHGRSPLRSADRSPTVLGLACRPKRTPTPDQPVAQLPEPSAPIDQQAVAVDAQLLDAVRELGSRIDGAPDVAAAGEQCGLAHQRARARAPQPPGTRDPDARVRAPAWPPARPELPHVPGDVASLRPRARAATGPVRSPFLLAGGPCGPGHQRSFGHGRTTNRCAMLRQWSS